jgi:hypothetical protein
MTNPLVSMAFVNSFFDPRTFHLTSSIPHYACIFGLFLS